MKIGFVSLGCSKNLVDTEMMIGIFKEHEFSIVNNPQEADIILINTCGFIESAKQEAINTILEMAEYKKKNCKYIIATGCLVQRYKEELEKALPEVDLFINCDSYDEFWKEVKKVIKNEKENKKYNLDYENRVITTGDKMAYLKIAEGCSNRCTYCAIPQIRGPFVSRKMEDVLKEARELAKKGIKELIVIAQDTTKYGIDIYGESKLAKLLEELCKIEGIEWIRFLYAYPETITDELIQVVKNNDKICKYFDIPIQHISDKVLKRMNRKSDSKSIKELIQKIRNQIPEVILRTTVIVGFPGETDEDFNELYNFIEQAGFDKLGAFTYSKEDGTPASRLKEQIHPMTKKSRYNKIMRIQQEISRKNLEAKIGQEYKVLLESVAFDGKCYIGRSYMDVPDMDGVVFIRKDNKQREIGQFTNCIIREIKDYDLIAEFKD
ncbi:MAG: 30S ribosomal protein S12 methylthiotransferase RimO [Clostridia bacterium]|nr:30S ribosomal protein S12 methylthiotransferase RimO [Clostridia bacterium]